jgi:serine/threonine protein kinase
MTGKEANGNGKGPGDDDHAATEATSLTPVVGSFTRPLPIPKQPKVPAEAGGRTSEPGERLSEPLLLGPYKLIKRIARGGMAETFLAERADGADGGRKLCVKHILPFLLGDKDTAQLFMDEARNGALLQHENIVRVVDYGQADKDVYLALEYIEGVSLGDLLRAQPENRPRLEPELVAHLAIELTTALNYSHNVPNAAGQRGVVHRDVSPSNVLLSRTGQVKLSDFGVAKAVGDKRRTATGFVRGKAAYMAPEYANTGKFDARCDQFSLGVVLYRCLTGAHPYQGSSDPEIVHLAGKGVFRPAAELAPDAPEALVRTVEKMIQADPAARFQTTGEVLQALMPAMPGPGVREMLVRKVGELCSDAWQVVLGSSGEHELPKGRTRAIISQRPEAPAKKEVPVRFVAPGESTQEDPAPAAGGADTGYDLPKAGVFAFLSTGRGKVMAAAVVAVILVGAGLAVFVGSGDDASVARPAATPPPEKAVQAEPATAAEPAAEAEPATAEAARPEKATGGTKAGEPEGELPEGLSAPEKEPPRARASGKVKREKARKHVPKRKPRDRQYNDPNIYVPEGWE